MNIAKEFIPLDIPPQTGEVVWSSPSNIALVKYWGKYGNQLPQNPSLSFTLSKCVSITSLAFKPKAIPTQKIDFSFEFEGQSQPDFHPKIEAFFQRIAPYCPYLYDHQLSISSSNSFPHSSGIASSASSMSALAMAVLTIEQQALPSFDPDYCLRKGSFLARLGSGSAARSINGPMMAWGKTKSLVGSSQDFAIPIDENIHAVFRNYHDTILIIDKGQKKVSSTLGHQLMEKHPYAHNRFEQAHKHMERLLKILEVGAIEDFMALVELEALTLHALMMASNPYFILMQPQTLAVINAVWDFRKTTSLPLCFTLDAGANVHLLYPDEHKVQIQAFIIETLSLFCQNGQYIEDQVGTGAKML